MLRSWKLIVQINLVDEIEEIDTTKQANFKLLSSCSSYLCWEKLTHGIVCQISSIRSYVFSRTKCSLGLPALVAEELVEQKGVRDEHGEEDHQDV